MDGDSQNPKPQSGLSSDTTSNVSASAGSPALVSFTCASCGASVPIRAVGLTVRAVCPACGSISDSQNGTFEIVQKAQGLMKVHPLFPLGSKGKLRGQTYQFIGFMRRFEKAYADQPWDEYLLYNPYIGYRWLACNKGHWTLFKVTQNLPKLDAVQSYSYLGLKFKNYHNGNAVVQFVLGEFYWKVKQGDTVRTLDFISPPYMLSSEKSDDEELWSLGKYIEPAEVAAAFHPREMPNREGVAPNQPSKYKDQNTIWVAWFLVLVALFVLQTAGNSFKTLKPVMSPSLEVPKTGLIDATLLEFTTDAATTHATLDVYSRLEQSWATVNLRVVSDDPKVGNIAIFEKDLSYYHGVDDGEAWSEGSSHEEFLLNQIPRGHYRVLVSVTPENAHTTTISADITMAPTVWSNFWLAFLFITIPPGWIAFRARRFEVLRWDDSEFNPYEKSES